MPGSPFRDNGWFEAPYIVGWLANLGMQGCLPPELDFVHPGDPPDPLALPPTAIALQLILDVLIAGQVVAGILVEPEQRVVWLERPEYWTSASARATLMSGKLDFQVYGLDPNLHSGWVYLNAYEIAAALGFRLVRPQDSNASSLPHPASSRSADDLRLPAEKLAVPNKPGGGGARMAGAVEAMVRAVQRGEITYDELSHLKQKELSKFFPAGRTLLEKAREKALAQLQQKRGTKTTKDIIATEKDK